jgi:hypothetical protein
VTFERSIRVAVVLVIAALCVAAPRLAHAHPMRSAYVEIVELEPGRARVTLQSPFPAARLALATHLPCALDEAAEFGVDVRWLACPGTVAGAAIRVEGLGPILSEAVVWSTLADGTSASSLLTRDHPTCTLPRGIGSRFAVVSDYVGFGWRHILAGYDHLFFLLGLVVVQRRIRHVLAAETAFTVSHSVTFAATALGWIRVASAPVECCIAASLVIVALEAARRSEADVRPPSYLAGAGLAFAFGLVHGLGFAGGLSEIGLPERAIGPALVGFATGVEIGQVAFLAIVLAIFALVERLAADHRFFSRGPRAVTIAATYAVGSVGCFWLFERLPFLTELSRR